MVRITKRRFLQILGGAGAFGATNSMFAPDRAIGATQDVRGITWGGPWIDATRNVTKNMGIGIEAQWFTYAENSNEVMVETKAAWPNPPYDIAANWDPGFIKMHNEGWIVPVTPAEVPNLADIPQSITLYRTDSGGVYGIPYSLAGAYWGYRKDLVTKPIRDIEDLLDPSLKGQIIMPAADGINNMCVVSMARAFGGDEHNLEPGWDFLKKLAQSGNIGRTAVADNDFAVSLNTGETSVGFMVAGAWNAVKPNWPCEILTRVPGSKAFKAYLFQEGFVIFKGPRLAETLKVMDYLLRPEVCEAYNFAIGQGSANSKSKSPPAASDFTMSADDYEKYAYFPDYAYIDEQLNSWVKYWEKNIQPLIRARN